MPATTLFRRRVAAGAVTCALALVVVLPRFAAAQGNPQGSAQANGDRDAVRRAVLDYVDGFYEGDSTKHVRSISPDVKKFGYYKPSGSSAYKGEAMPYAEFMAYTRRVRENKRFAPATAPKEIVIYDVQDQTAVAKLTAYWGTDYLTLAKVDGRWMVMQVLWQTPMPR